jgi:hypothetical protein
MPNYEDKPSASAFYKAIADAVPKEKDIVVNFAKGYVAGKIVKHVAKKSK